MTGMGREAMSSQGLGFIGSFCMMTAWEPSVSFPTGKVPFQLHKTQVTSVLKQTKCKQCGVMRPECHSRNRSFPDDETCKPSPTNPYI